MSETRKPLHYNNPKFSDARVGVVGLTTDESTRAVKILDKSMHSATEEEKELVQRLIYRYENLEHFEAIHSGDD